MKQTLLAFGMALACCAAVRAADPPPANAGGKAIATVHIKNFAYHESKITVHAGDIVRFVNDDDDAHTVTASDKTYDSGGLDTGEGWSRTFAKPGTYSYFCALHPYMKALVVVLPASQKGN